ncbi:hypothetical protein [Paenibacillus silagei]|uniref:Gas vesicle protein n=1 Tax=Paenibacillus silagei TaxID=1670801 RepID=A0ABS4NRT9_9BACL|nr:hypothetical protein [Paenibacillus silagei]MBP2112769.1 gas vesicle protein [Paenibacillus silagei]
MASQVWKNQITAVGIGAFNDWKQEAAARKIDQTVRDVLAAQGQQESFFENALGHMQKMRQFLAKPDNILGSGQTKHGEVAEQMEVHVRNARAALHGNPEVATFEGVGRTAPEDFILKGVKVQSKFINGTNNTLKHVLEHFDKYENLSMDYSIPKEQYEIIQTIRSGSMPAGLNEKSVRAILKKVEELEQRTGRSFQNVVKPSISEYSEVQLGKAGETVTKVQDQLVDENRRIQKDIRQDGKEKVKQIEAQKSPSIREGVKAAGTAAAVSASLSAVTAIYRKVKEGKKLHEFEHEDWQEIGLDGAKAGVTAGTIYALTNLTSLSAPFAGAVASAMMGLSSLMADLEQEQISMDEFVTQGQVLCIEAGIAATGGAIGQMLIPVPVLGSIVGTVTANLVWGFAKGKLEAREQELKCMLDAYTDSLLAKVDQAYQEIITRINQTYSRYHSLIDAAFDVKANSAVLAAASVDLAVELGVEESRILRTDEDLFEFFMG